MKTIAFVALALTACSVPQAMLDPDSSGGVVVGDGGLDGRADAPVDATPLRPATLAGSPLTGTMFGDVVIGGTSTTTYTITNTGELASGAIAIAFDDPSAGFALADDHCSTHAIEPQMTCTFTVAFTPLAAGAAATTVHASATPGSDVARDLGGTGLVPGTVSLVDSYDFGSLGIDASPVTHTFTVTNTGQLSIGAPSPTIPPAMDSYVVQSTTCTAALAPNATCDVVVRFDPSTVGTKPGALTVAASGGGSDAATLIGLAVANVAIAKPGNGAGVVQSNQTGIACGTACAADFSATPVSLTAVADPGSTFDGWGGDCAAGTGSCALDLTGAKRVTATFTAITPTLAVTFAGTGMGAVGSSPAGIACTASCAANFPWAQLVTLTASAQTGSTFTGWGGACSGTTPCMVTMDQMQNVTATFTLQTFSLLYAAGGGTGDGTVALAPVGTPDCGPGCATFPYNQQVTITATPANGSKFDGWTGCTSTTASCVVTMTQARSVTAKFTLLTEDLTTATIGTGAIALDVPGTSCGTGCARYDWGTVVTLTATAGTGWTFDSWLGCPSSSGATCTATMDQARTITAKFTINTYPLTYGTTSGSTGTGTVSPSPAGTADCGAGCASFSYNTSVTLTAAPHTGSHFDGWTGCTSSTSSCTVAMTAARTVTARFTLDTHTLTTTVTGTGTLQSSPAGITCTAGATTGCSAVFDDGTAVALVASPPVGWLFDTWSGACAGMTTATCNLAITASTTVGVAFKHDTRTLSVMRNGNGTVTSAPAGIACGTQCNATFNYGTSVTLTAVAATGSSFLGWTGACTNTTGTCTVLLDQAQGVGAMFQVNTYPLTTATNGTGSGSISPNPTGIADCGTNCASYDYSTPVTLTATPSAGSHFVSWTGCTSSTNVCSLTMTAARTVTATFTLNQYTLATPVTGGGTIACNGGACATSYDYGTALAITATPAAGWVFAAWSGACLGAGAVCNVTITDNTTAGASFSPKLTVTLDPSGTGAGSVSSNPTGITCGTTCAAAFAFNSVVMLTASPQTGSHVTWGGACAGSTGTSCSVPMSQVQAVTARFDLDRFALTVTPPSNGTIASTTAPGFSCGSTCSATYAYGTSVAITATPASGYLFSAWTGACAGTTGNSCTLAITSAVTVGATFVQDTRSLAVNVTGDGAVTSNTGGINCPGGSCTATYPVGTTVILTATAGTGSSFGSWVGCPSASGNTCTATMDTTRTINATFAVNSYALTATPPTGGSIGSSPSGLACGSTCSAPFAYGTAMTLTATSQSGWTFARWGGSATCGAGSTCTFAMPAAATTVSATFDPALTVTPQAGTSTGTVTSASLAINCGSQCTATFPYNASVALTATPAAHAHVVWGGACSGSSTCTVTMSQVQGVTARFDLDPEPLTVSVGGSGSVSGTNINCPSGACSSSYPYGTSVLLTATPATGWQVSSWSGGGCSGTTTTCSVPMTQAQSVNVTFAPIIYTVNLGFAGTGSGSVTINGSTCTTNCARTYPYGTAISMTASPSSGFFFSGWSGAGCSGTGGCSFTLAGNTNVTATFDRSFTLTVASSTRGTVSGPGINCPGTCSATYGAGTVVSLDLNGVFSSCPSGSGVSAAYWIPTACTGGVFDGSSTCTVTMNADTAVSVTWFHDCN